MKIPNLTYYTYSLIDAPKIHTDLLWDLTMLFVGLGTVYFVSIFIFRNSISRKNKNSTTKKLELSPKISEFLFHEEDDPIADKANYIDLKIEVREFIKIPANRKILTEVLLDLRKDVAGDTLKRLCKLYKDFGLHNDAYKKLKSWRWERVAKGILELTQMQVMESYGFIIKHINDKRPTVRRQAEIAVVSLKPEGINHFLDTTRYKISEWQQLKLLDVIRNQEDFKAPRFRSWLTSKNKHVVLFALRLIKYYNQNDANSSIIELIKHKDTNIRQEAIDCIREFLIFDAIDSLKSVFKKSTVDTKLCILEAFSHIGSATDISYLKALAQKESNFTVKSKILGTINTIAPETIMPTENIMEISDKAEVLEMETLAEDIERLEQITETTDTETPTAIENQLSLDKQIPTNQERIKMDIEETTNDDHIENENIDELLKILDARTKTNPAVTVNENEDEITFELSFELDDDFATHSEKSLISEDCKASNNEIPAIFDMNDIDSKKPQTPSEHVDNTPEKSHTTIDREEEMHNTRLQSVIGKILQNSKDMNHTPEMLTEDDINQDIVSEEENIEIFDICFMQELEDILSGIDEMIEDKDNQKTLPLDFLPIVKAENKTDGIGVTYEEVPFDKEPRMLDEHNRQSFTSDEEDIDMSFIPLVVDNDNHAPPNMDLDHGKTNEMKNKPPIPNVGFKGFSIFEELFRTCDTDSKLILLDEVLAVGDQKEIEFLDTLLDSPEKSIAEKAKEIKEKLAEKLSDSMNNGTLESIGIKEERGPKANIETIENAEQQDIFDFDFDLELEIDNEDTLKKKTLNNNWFLNHIIPSFLKR
ncbi:HEAT repeat domain-containing protein [Costertonia aggregata]|uniref:HEAT repeat domain-containing protein n=1 Tax=Costertonia aggregata TaxID=343403 RepID=A0A7H9AUA5_9FLAO|nr:HEAT repeat domain-containing protein [Costertonia aggregata]QLG47016.1 HEAT repeat domain-containing protein [Costertonia aggregata]